jgi:hypothetical protein
MWVILTGSAQQREAQVHRYLYMQPQTIPEKYELYLSLMCLTCTLLLGMCVMIQLYSGSSKVHGFLMWRSSHFTLYYLAS